MRMGKRLKKEIDDRGIAPVDLCARIPDLDIGTLSAIYTRDSEYSKYAPAIAKELGLDLHWFLTGEGEKFASASSLNETQKMLINAFPLLEDGVRSIWLSSAQDALARAVAKNKAA